MNPLHDISWSRWLLLPALLLAGCPANDRTDDTRGEEGAAGAGALAETPLASTASVSASELRRHVAYLAADALEGRGASTKGLERAADYLERELRGLGLTPLFGKSFRQPFEMTVGARLGEGNALAQQNRRKETQWDTLRVGRDFAPFTFSSTGTVEGSLAFLGYGIRSKEHRYDDYADIEVRGRVLVVLSGEPGEDDPKSPFDGKRATRYSALRKKVLDAREAGASAILIIRDRLKLPGPSSPEESDAGIIALGITAAAAKRLLGFDALKARAEIDAAYRPKSRAAETGPVRVSASIARDRRTVANVGALLEPPPGATTTTQAVVIGAHYDHLGFGGSGSLSGTDAPQIHNGADDNASGSATVLEVARALAKEPRGLRRRVVFLWFAGEESGLLGSAHYAKNPPLPLPGTVAMVNLDMVGRMRQRRLFVLGVDSAPELRPLAARVLASRHLTGEYTGDAYGPSDHTSFYARGVPVLFLFTGAHEHYHRPSDDVETLDYPAMAEVAAVATDLVRVLASAEAQPRYVALPAPPPSDGRGYGPFFGSIPDFGENKDGVPLSGVRKGSPAEKAGLTQGDVLIRFNGVRVKSLQDFTQALRDTAPGDVVALEYLRGGETKSATATLEKRPSE